MKKQQNDQGDDGGFYQCLNNVLNHLEPIDALLENPVFKAELRRICSTLTFNQADAEEIFNDACLRLTQKIDKFDPSRSDASFIAWIRTMVRNLFFDRARRKSPKFDDTPSDELYGLRDSGATPEERFWQGELEDKLNDLIDKQDEPERLMLKYCLEDGLSFRQIAKTLEKHGIHRSHVTIGKVVRKLLKEFFDTKVSIPDVNRKANKLSKRPVEKARIRRKTAEVSKPKVTTRRTALKK